MRKDKVKKVASVGCNSVTQWEDMSYEEKLEFHRVAMTLIEAVCRGMENVGLNATCNSLVLSDGHKWNFIIQKSNKEMN